MSNFSRIDSVAALEGVIGKTPPPAVHKVIDHLDAWALRWIAATPLMLVNFGDTSGIRLTLGGGTPGFASGDAHELRLPIAVLDNPELAQPGLAFASLFLLPGIGETLRINGKVVEVGPSEIRIAVEECFGHCAKALLRSKLWSAVATDKVPDDPAAFVAASSFMVLATLSAEGRADLSPKGDPAGLMARLDGDTLWFADRPGNRRVDSFRNILTQPRIAMVLLIPGSPHITVLSGEAAMTTDEASRERFTVEDKTPKLVTRVQTSAIEMRTSQALARAQLWPATLGAHGIDPIKLALDHIKLNRAHGFGAKMTNAVLTGLNATGLVQKIVDKEYKDGLY